MEEPKYIEQPYDHSDNHDPVEDRLDRSLHGDEAVNQPEQHSDGDERENNLDERHSVLLSSRSRRPESVSCTPALVRLRDRAGTRSLGDLIHKAQRGLGRGNLTGKNRVKRGMVTVDSAG